MLIIPAINILGGNVVWLRQGEPVRSTVYAHDPLAVARQFVDAGARSLYIHDIDSMLGADVSHFKVAAQIAAETDVRVLFGATIRTATELRAALERPFAQVVLRVNSIAGTAFLRAALREHAGHLAIRLDVRNGNVHLESPERTGPADPVVLAREVIDSGARRLVYSDLNRDGMLGGPNYAGLRALLRVVDVPVTVSGGIAHHDHIRNLERLGVEALIIGKALYTGDLTLRGHLDERGHWRS